MGGLDRFKISPKLFGSMTVIGNAPMLSLICAPVRSGSNQLEQQASVGCEEWGEHQRLNCHELDKDVEGRAGRVLEWVPDCVPDHSCFMGIRAFRAERLSVLGCTRLDKKQSKDLRED